MKHLPIPLGLAVIDACAGRGAWPAPAMQTRDSLVVASTSHSVFDDEDTPPTLYRLKRLISVGYVPEHSDARRVPNAMWLTHPSARAAEPSLVLFVDGLLVGGSQDGEQLCIRAEDGEGFDRFVRRIRDPALWGRAASLRARMFILMAVLAIALSAAICHLVD